MRHLSISLLMPDVKNKRTRILMRLKFVIRLFLFKRKILVKKFSKIHNRKT